MVKFLTFGPFLMALALAPSAFAVPSLSAVYDGSRTVLNVNADGAAFSAFVRGDALWFVSRQPEAIAVNMPSATWSEVKISSVEELATSGGAGVRVMFEEGTQLSLRVQNPPQEEARDGVDMVPLDAGLRLVALDVARLVSAESEETGGIVTVIPRTTLTPQQEDVYFGDVHVLPTLVGYAFEDAKGGELDIALLGDDVVLGGDLYSATAQDNPLAPPSQRGTLTPEDLSLMPTDPLLPDDAPRANAVDALSRARAAIEQVSKLPLPDEKAAENVVEDQTMPDALKLAEGESPFAKQVEHTGGDAGEYVPPPSPDPAKIAPEDEVKDDLALQPTAVPVDDILLPRYGFNRYEYQKFYKRFLKRFVDATSNSEREEARLRLARLNMAFERPQEAVSMLLRMAPDEGGKLPADPRARVILGAAHVLSGQPDEGVPLLEENIGPVNDRNIWLAAAYSAQGRHEEAYPLFKEYVDFSGPYPLWLQRELRLAYARTLLAMERPGILAEEMELLGVLLGGEIPPEGLLLMARAEAQRGNTDVADSLFAEAANSDDAAVAYNGQYEFVMHLLKKDEIGRDQVIEHLENLRYLWRGGKMEEDILFELGRMYLNRGNDRTGLERLKYLTIYFSDSERLPVVADLMTTSFVGLFADDHDSTMDELATIAMYYDFRELTPPGQSGDDLIAKIAAKLKGLGLFERAIPLLKHQLKYRTKGPENLARVGHELAELYLLNRDYEDGLAVLVATEARGLKGNLKEERDLLQAQLYIAMKDFLRASQTLKKMKGEKASRLRAYIAWVEEDYDALVANLAGYYARKPGESLPNWTPEERADFIKLAMGHNFGGDLSGLEDLQQRYPEKMNDPEIAQISDFLLRDMHSYAPRVMPKDASGRWQSIVSELGEYNTFTDDYNVYKEAREAEKIQRALFNRRLKQASPPPRL